MLEKLFRRAPTSADLSAVPARPDGGKPMLRVIRPDEPKRLRTGILRHDTLVSQMLDDHRLLFALFGSVKADADAARWEAVQEGLAEFRSALTDHLLLETVKLYAFLRQEYAGDEETLTSIQDFSGEMNVIRREVTTSLAHYADVATSSQKQMEFSRAWAGIGKALSARIAREEKSLYPLY